MKLRLTTALFTCALAASLLLAASASAAVVYTKDGKTYVTNAAGTKARVLAGVNASRVSLSRDGQTVIYSDASGALFAIPAAGGPSRPIGAGLKCLRNCAILVAPNNASALLINPGSDAVTVDHVPLDGSAPRSITNKGYSWASYSPDSKQIAYDVETTESLATFTVPVAGGAPRQLPTQFAMYPIWVDAGIASWTFAEVKNKPQFRISLLDPVSGATKRVLTRDTVQSEKALDKLLETGRGVQVPYIGAGNRLVTAEVAKRGRAIFRILNASNGKVKAKRTVKFSEVEAISFNGARILLRRKGRLTSVNIKTGKRTTIVKSGVKRADTN